MKEKKYVNFFFHYSLVPNVHAGNAYSHFIKTLVTFFVPAKKVTQKTSSFEQIARMLPALLPSHTAFKDARKTDCPLFSRNAKIFT